MIIFLKCRISTPSFFVRLSKRIEVKLTWLNYSLTDRINGRISIKKSSLWIETFPFFLCWFQWSWNSSSWNGLKWPQICSQMAERRSLIESKLYCINNLLIIKRGCVFPMVIWPAFRMGQYRVNDNPYHAPQFTVYKKS